MTVAPINTAVFPLFSSLPAELRNHIWEDALPDATEPALVAHNLECWRVQGAEPDMELEYHHELLDVHIEMPMAFVNCEARSIAMARIRQHGLSIKPCREQYPVFTRPFNPSVDALYISRCGLVDIIEEALELPALEGRAVSIISHFRNIAMSDTNPSGKILIGDLPEFLCCFTSVKELLVVVNAPPALESVGAKSLWKFASAPGDAFCWTTNSRLFDICGKGEHFGDGVVAAMVSWDYLAQEFTELRVSQSSFTVRPIFAYPG